MSKQHYAQGFMDKCALSGVDPEALYKLAQDKRVDPLKATKVLGATGAIGGAALGASLGGAVGTISRNLGDGMRFGGGVAHTKLSRKAVLVLAALGSLYGAKTLGVPGLAAGGAVDIGRAAVRKSRATKTAGIGKLLAVAAPSLGLGYLGGRKHQEGISQEKYGIIISKLMQRQRETMKDNLSKNLLGR